VNSRPPAFSPYPISTLSTTHTEHLFPAHSAEEKQPQNADVALLRRKEVSKIGRFLRNNGVSNESGPLTLLMK